MSDSELKAMVNDIHKALIGDEYNNEGLIKKVHKNKKRIALHDKIIYGVIGAYLLAVFILSFGHDLIKLVK